jgi:hypothetical protein
VLTSFELAYRELKLRQSVDRSESRKGPHLPGLEDLIKTAASCLEIAREHLNVCGVASKTRHKTNVTA